MESSVSNLVDNLPKGIHKINCNYEHDNKTYEERGIKYKDCGYCLEYVNVKYDLIVGKTFFL